VSRLATFAFAGALASFAYGAAAAADLGGTWAITPAAADGKFYFDLTIQDPNGHERSHSGNDYALASLGLTQQQLAGSGHHVAFTISRDAGSFACEGWIANGRGGGTVTFTPSANYIVKMNGRGYDPSLEQLASAATVDLSNAFVDGLAAAGIERPSFEDLIAMRALNAGPEYVNGLHSAGIDVVTAREIISLKALNVDAPYVKSLAAVGYTNLSSHQLVEMRALKIDADFVRKVKARGIAHPTVEDLVRLKSMDAI
jgi:hypothetical protein